MKAVLSYCDSSSDCRKIEGVKLSEKDGKMIFTGVDDVNGIQLGVTLTEYAKTESQNSSTIWGGVDELDYAHLSQIWGVAFSSIVFFYFSGRIAGAVLEFIKKEAFH
ncbi:hypothetical protein Q7404_10300 [Glaesserella parasuis]|nr:hypothetical protein [Glaesserella parasuis]